jgi:hypothetical protein
MVDDNHPITLKSSEAVAYRVLSLGALVMRGVLEQHYRNTTSPEDRQTTETGIRALIGWMVEQNLIEQQTVEERRCFRRALGEWDRDYLNFASWRVEALGVLLWALVKADSLPLYDTLFSVGDVLDAIPLYDPVTDFVADARLRPTDEITQAHDIAELWDRRSWVTQQQQLNLDPPPGMTFQQIIQEAAEQAHLTGDAPPPIDGDLPAFGKAYATLSAREYLNATAIALQRHFALNWLCGYLEDWDETMPNL